jgi:2'-hydroxyisoflavone reductase
MPGRGAAPHPPDGDVRVGLMRILFIGGTSFIGRHAARCAIDSGHNVTLFHRGVTGSELFPEATHLTGDRDSDLSALAGGSWDATIDLCAYYPRQVRSLAQALGGRGGRYVYISSLSAYADAVPWGYDESAELTEVTDPDAEAWNYQNYGGLKVACERAAAELHGPATTIVRPAYVIGPHDATRRFTWWVGRLARGGQVLAPGRPADLIQLIDARDLGCWLVSMLERRITGTFHVVDSAPPFGWGDMLQAIATAVAPPGTELIWVPSDFLRARGLDGVVVPLWGEGDARAPCKFAASPAAAFAAGLNPRPLAQTIAGIQAADRELFSSPPGVGVPPELEAEVLARWAAQSRP